MSQTLVHLIYIHGFQGNDTSFQVFPTDLQQYLSTHIPSNLNIKIQSSLYPTYKSKKALSLATQNFLAWLSTQPPGPVILMAHSMGGLLAADAATDAFNTGLSTSRRILGVVSFDVPFLGMHPHVVVSGLASLFPEDSSKKKTEADMNQHKDVNIVDDQVTDDWDAFRKKVDADRSRRSLSPLPSPHPVESSSLASPAAPPRSPTSFIDKTVSFISTQSNSKLGTWLKKHSNDPFSAGTRFIVDYFEFGSSMFDPSGLKERYSRLVAWPGLWVNYWTHVPHPKGHAKDDEAARVPTLGSMSSDVSVQSSSSSTSPPQSPSASTTDEKALKKAAKAQAKEARKREREQKGHHFIVLPTGIGELLGGSDKWEKVEIAGVDDEVAAHCGLFIRGQNLEYDELVQRVAKRVLEWCATLK